MIVDGQNQNVLYVVCPHCEAGIEVPALSLNCSIFRHGAFTDTLEPIDSHTPQYICEWFVANNLIYGCGKPFAIVQDASGVVSAVKCDYI